MVAPREVGAILAHDPRLTLLVPPVEGPPARLGERLAAGEFPLLAASLARMVLRELMSQRRLRPGDAVGEIDILRALATALTATAGRLLTLEEVQQLLAETGKPVRKGFGAKKATKKTAKRPAKKAVKKATKKTAKKATAKKSTAKKAAKKPAAKKTAKKAATKKPAAKKAASKKAPARRAKKAAAPVVIPTTPTPLI